MNPEIPSFEDRRQRSKSDLRQRGIFFLLGGLIFLLQGLFILKDQITWYLLEILLVVYGFLSPSPLEMKQTSWTKKIFQLIGRFSLFLIASVVILLGWGWIWKDSRIPFSYLAAITFGIIGLALILLSCANASRKSKS